MTTVITNYEEVLEAAGAALYDVLVVKPLGEDAEAWNDLALTSKNQFKAKVQPVVQAVLEAAQ